jgi:membrane-bound metal-dependent hydrolase YbcI (DUF457 family)
VNTGRAWLAEGDSISWTAASAGAFVGTFSHVLLDSPMHTDLKPFAPFTSSNQLLHIVSLFTLHSFCVVTGALGLVAWIAAHYRRQSIVRRSQI